MAAFLFWTEARAVDEQCEFDPGRGGEATISFSPPILKFETIKSIIKQDNKAYRIVREIYFSIQRLLLILVLA